MKKSVLSIALAMGIGLTVGMSVLSGQAAAEWPDRPVTLIVTWSAGGGTDATGRVIAKHLQDRFGQPFNVVNRTGGGGLIGHTAIANAEPDGYTLGVVTVEIAMYPHQKLGDINHDSFALISRYNADAVSVNVKADSPYKTAKDLVAAIKADPGRIKASGANRGGLAHLGWAGLVSAVGLDPNAAPWVASEGAAPALQQLVSGAIDVVSTTLAESQPLVDAGEVRTLVLMANERNATFPDVPSMPDALGVKWAPLSFRGIAGPKGLPDEIVKKVSDAMGEITKNAEFVDFMNKRGFSINYLHSEAFKDFVIGADRDFGAAMKAAGII